MQVTLHYVESVKYGKPLFTSNNEDDCLTYKGIRYLTDDERAELRKQRIKRAFMRAAYIVGLTMREKVPLSNKSCEES